MTPRKTLSLVAAAFLLGLLLQGKGCSLPDWPWPIVGPVTPVFKAPFKTPTNTAAIFHDASAVGSLPSWVQGNTPVTVEGWCKANKMDFRLLDKDSNPALLEAKWQGAIAVPRTSTPWIVAAGPQTGFSKPLPPTAAEATKLLAEVK